MPTQQLLIPSAVRNAVTASGATTRLVYGCLFLLLLAVMTSCSDQQPASKAVQTKDLVHRSVLNNVRLGDGVPLDLEVFVRWRIEDVDQFAQQFSRPEEFDSLILKPRQVELARQVANAFPNVDSVFTSERQLFIDAVKGRLVADLGEEGITIKEIIVSDVRFPPSFTIAMEKIAMNERELERIRQQKVVDLEKAIAAKEQAEADGQIEIAQAKVDGRVQQINAETEENRRAMEVARAETESQLIEANAKAEARRIELLAEAEKKKLAALNTLEVDKRRQLDLAQLDKQRAEEEIALDKMRGIEELENDKQLALANLCQQNPNYATFLVNKELASKVQIAVLPSGQDANIFGDLLKNGLAKVNN